MWRATPLQVLQDLNCFWQLATVQVDLKQQHTQAQGSAIQEEFYAVKKRL
jgi:hypothetical protein